MSKYEYFEERTTEPLVLEPDDWTSEEWATILKLFGMSEAEKITISDYKFEAYGIQNVVITQEQWDKALEHLNTYIMEYSMIGPMGFFGLQGVLVPLKRRYESGERTKELYDAMMNVE